MEALKKILRALEKEFKVKIEIIGEKKPRKKPSKKSEPDANDLFLATQMARDLAKRSDNFKVKNIEVWANHIRLMRTEDDRHPGDILSVWTAAHNDAFWGKVILSPQNLRKHFDRLRLINIPIKPSKGGFIA